MKSDFLRIYGILLLVGLNYGCTPSNSSFNHRQKVISLPSILNEESVTDAEKSEKLALASETLLAAQAYDDANKVALQSLQLDSKNVRAGLIASLVSPIILLKGIVARIAPLTQKSNSLNEILEKKLIGLKNNSNASKLYAYLNDGTPDIDTEVKLQNFIDILIGELDKLRLYLKNIKGQTLVFKSNAILFDQITSNYIEACRIYSDEKKAVYEIECPDDRLRHEVMLNRADFEVIQAHVSRRISELSLIAAYDLTGTVEMYGKKLNVNSDSQFQNLYDNLLLNTQFGLLRPSSNLSKIKDLGLEVVDIINWITDSQRELCPTARSYGDKAIDRLGMLYNKEVCGKDILRFHSSLSKLDSKGKITNYSVDFYSLKNLTAFYQKVFQNEEKLITISDNRKYLDSKYSIIYGKLINNPIPDIRSLGSLKFDNCGQLQSVGDSTFGGMFPKGEANKYLDFTRSECRR